MAQAAEGVLEDESLPITLAVAVTRPDRYRLLLASLEGQFREHDHFIVVLEGVEIAEPAHIPLMDGRSLEIRYVRHSTAQGLSCCRNKIIELAPTRFVVFLDDDTEATPDLLQRYRKRFAEDQQVVGGSLCLPEGYPTWPLWLPRTYGSLLGIHQAEKKIWGGNFGFDRHFAIQHGLCFARALGRHGNNLWSGDDTSFVKDMESRNARILFDPAIVVYHHISTSRFNFRYLLRRAYWQGRSEVLRRSIGPGLRKEFRRAFGQTSPRPPRSLRRVLAGALLFTSVVLGVIVQLVADLLPP
jgi:glycosyltransferase involved in cell wall biosynthesis